jgi:hypothetical protein
MARYEQSYAGERRSAFVGVQFTPTERAELVDGAAAAGARLSEYVRELCLRRSAAPVIVAGVRRNPEAKALINELIAIGNNLNQLARHANINGAMPEAEELYAVITTVKAAMARVLAL